MHSQKNQSFLKRLRFALAGIYTGLKSENSLRFQIFVLLCVVISLIAVGIEPVWWAIIALTCSAVISAELFNTALEHLADHLHPETHPQIQIVKDCAAAAVLITVLGALAVAAAVAVHIYRR
jgi:undecaprenol kinase